MKKRLLAIALTAVLVLSCSACGSKITERSENRSSSSSEQHGSKTKRSTSKKTGRKDQGEPQQDWDQDTEDPAVFSEQPDDIQAPVSNETRESKIYFSDEPYDETGEEIMTLEEIIDSDEMQSTLADMNAQAAGSGIVIDIVAEGNSFVYEYWLPDEDAYNSLTPEQAEALFEPTVTSYTSSVQEIFTSFEEQFNLILDSVRFTFYTADSGVLYTIDIPNE